MPNPTSAYSIVGDWGTSRLRLFLSRHEELIDTLEGPGVSDASPDLASVLFSLVGAWVAEHGPIPILLSGMVGSTIGWRDVPYLSCPVQAERIGDALHLFEAAGHTVGIVPGLRCVNPLGGPDLIRGEETQILGALANDPGLARGRHLLCLPGTHTKWVELDGGVITTFLTGFSGDLFAALRRASVLSAGSHAGEVIPDAAFRSGLGRRRASGSPGCAGLLHLLFEARARTVIGELSNHESTSYLSGLIIEEDVAGALEAFAENGLRPGTVEVIGTRSLVDLYAEALDAHDIQAVRHDGAARALQGLRALQPHLQHPEENES